jgi:hypothetical protein
VVPDGGCSEWVEAGLCCAATDAPSVSVNIKSVCGCRCFIDLLLMSCD